MTAYLLFEMKKPGDSGNVWLPKFIEKHLNNEWVIKILGDDV